MNKIDFYVLRIYSFYFFSFFLGTLAIIVLFDSVDTLVSTPDLARAAFLAIQLLPSVVELITPYVGLLACLLTFSSLYRFGEIISMKVAGLSQVKILRSIYCFGTLVVFFLYMNQSYFFRWVRAEKNTFSLVSVPVQIHWYQLENQLVHIQPSDSFSGKLSRVEAYQFDKQPKINQRVIYENLSPKNSHWFAEKVTKETMQNGQVKLEVLPGQEVKEIHFDQLLSQPPYPILYQSFNALYRAWKSPQKGEYVADLALLLLLKKIAYLLSFFLFLFLGVAFSESQPRMQKNVIKIVAATLIYYAYWFLDQFLFVLAREKTIPILFGAFSLPFLLLVALFLIIRLKKL